MAAQQSSESESRTVMEDSDIALTAISADRNCFSCSHNLSDDAIYRCLTCTDPTIDGKVLPKVYCEMCLPIPHIRLKHHIVDHRGYKPSICQTHKSICIFFCASCQVVFCRFCTEKHCVHIFNTVKIKALEIRKNIFSAMTENEEKAKPLRHQNFVLREFGKQCEPICNSLRPENVTNTLSAKFEQVIRNNSHKWAEELAKKEAEGTFTRYSELEKEQERFAEVLLGVDNNIRELKHMLAMSDSSCVTEYLKFEHARRHCLEKHNEANRQIYIVKLAKGWDEAVEKSILNCIQQIKMPQLKKQDLKLLDLLIECREKVQYDIEPQCDNISSFSLDEDYNSSGIFNLQVTPLHVSFSVLKRPDNAWMEETLSLDISDVISVHRYKKYVVLWMKNSTLKIVDLDTCDYNNASPSLENIKTDGAHLLHFFYSVPTTYKLLFYRDNQQHLELHTGVLLENGSFFDTNLIKKVRCLTRPKHASCSASFLASVGDGNCVHVVGLASPDNVLEIQHFELGLFQIDQIFFFCSNKMNIFDYKTRIIVTVQIIHESNNQLVDWSVIEAYQLNVPHDDKLTLCGNIGRSNFYAYTGTKIFLGKA